MSKIAQPFNNNKTGETTLSPTKNASKKMRLLILDENYPHPDNLVGDVFVHVRAQEYAKLHEVKVFSYFYEPRQLTYEGISLEMFKDVDLLVEAIRQYNPDKILIHFYQSWMLEKVIKVFKVPALIWVHGYEAQGWYRRLFNYKWYTPVFLNYIYTNTKQQLQYRRLIAYSNKTGQVRFVFVSNWMRKTTEHDTLSKIKNYNVIHNPIDGELFKYHEKDEALRKKVLIFRSFHTRKYANDISVKAILLLSKRPCFKEFSFTIIGKGQLFESILRPIKHFPNIKITKGALLREEIPLLHREHGIFLCPTRQDAQGVSMCEAMASGLVVVTSNNTAIPEFVKNNESGILTNNSPKQVADALEMLLQQPQKFKEISRNASPYINKLCDIHNITARELSVIEA